MPGPAPTLSSVELEAQAPHLKPLNTALGVLTCSRSDVTQKMHVAFADAGMGGVKEAKGSNNKTISFVCSAIDSEEKSEGGAKPAQMTIPHLIDEPGIGRVFVEREILFDASPLAGLNSRNMDQLRSELAENEQPVSGSRDDLIGRCAFGRLSGRLPRCPCDGSFHWQSSVRMFHCNGTMLVPCTNVMKFPPPNQSFAIWTIPPTIHIVPCDLHIKVVLRENKGFHVVAQDFRPCHSIGCNNAVRYTGAVIESKLKPEIRLRPDGRTAVQHKVLISQSGLGSAASTSVIRAVKKMKEEMFDKPSQEAAKKTLSTLIEFSRSNPGTRVTIHSTRDGKSTVTDIDNGVMGEPMEMHEPKDRPVVLVDMTLKAARRRYAEQVDQAKRRRNQRMLLLANVMIEQHYIERDEADKEYRAACDRAFNDYTSCVEGLSFNDFDEHGPDYYDNAFASGERPEDSPVDGDQSPPFVDDQSPPFVDDIELRSLIVVFGPSVRMFRNIGKRVIGIDGAHMKDGAKRGEVKGQLLLVVIEDSLGNILPLAVSYCYSESAQNISSLFDALSRANVDLNDKHVIIMSDRGRAGIKAVAERLPNANLRLCSEHIVRNIQNKLKRKLSPAEKALISACFLARTRQEYEICLRVAREKLPGAASTYFANIDPERYASYFYIDQGLMTFDRTTNNNVESENNRQKWTRRQRTPLDTILKLAESVQGIIARRQKDAQQFVQQKHYILPRILAEVASFQKVQGEYEVKDIGSSRYKVSSVMGDVFNLVNVEKFTCDCCQWQNYGIPCVHAAMVKLKRPTVFTDEAYFRTWFNHIYRTDRYSRAYAMALQVPDPRTVVAAPDECAFVLPRRAPVAAPGRPKEEKRMRSKGEF
jgi:hypothetical protein